MNTPAVAQFPNPGLTDLGNAQRFVERHGENVRYVTAWGKFLIWDSPRWRLDDTGEAFRRACETARSIWTEIELTDSLQDKKDLSSHALRSEAEPKIRAMVAIAANDESIVLRPTTLDADPWLVAVKNGVLDLRSSELREGRRDDLLTKMVPVLYDPEAAAPRWKEYLGRVLDGNARLEAYLQRAVGYSLTGTTDEQVLFFLYGTGSNGKSLFLSILRELFGGYGATSDFNTFLQRRSDSPRSDLARLEGARFVSAIEASDGRRLDEATVKQLTGQDIVTARRLYQEEVEFQPAFKLWFSANHKPTIRGTDLAIWRRIHLIPFTVTIPEEERDPELRDTLRDELPGILNWVLEGCHAWQTLGLEPPPEVVAATEQYRVESDILGAFLEESCVIDPDAITPSALPYAAYKDWCFAAGEHLASKTAFGTRLSERGIETKKMGAKNNAHRVGIRLRAASEFPDNGESGWLGMVSGNSPREPSTSHFPYNPPELSGLSGNGNELARKKGVLI